MTGDGKGYYEAVTPKQTKAGWVSNPDKLAGSLDVKENNATKSMTSSTGTVYVEVSGDGTFDIVSTEPSGDDWVNAATVGNTTTEG